MKRLINFTTSSDDTGRFCDREDLKGMIRRFGCDGLELMPLGTDKNEIITSEMIVGIHANCLSDWMDMNTERLLEHYRKDLEFARMVHAEYVVFHVTQVSYAECLTYRLTHTDEQVIPAAARLINLLLDGQDYDFYFLMENLWWPGLNFLDPNMTRYLLNEVHYPKKGLLLDTGHFMNTNPELHTAEEAMAYLHTMLDQHEALIPMIRGIHLNLSLSGSYVKAYKKSPSVPSSDPDRLCCQAFEHIFRVDQHRPFAAPAVSQLISRINPLFVTLEYITRNRVELENYLRQGTEALLYS